ncbi:MAG: ATP-binding cassette domain-containing protein, partial [Anaerolineales bacterium]|nr:ATP-binding cassette domain-containing protein [Anaerolineales bacterium]
MTEHTLNENNLIDLKGVVKQYQSMAGNVVALKGIDLQVQAGEFFVVTGKSGAGKTTLINMITGLDGCTEGNIYVNSVPVHELSPAKAAAWRGQHVGVVFQTFELLPTLTILHNVMLPMDFAGKYSRRERKQRALLLLDQVEIAGHAGKLPSEVSGGQQQRVAIARA